MSKIKNKINIMAHRGLWKKKSEQNTINSLILAIKNGFSVEFDVRDVLGRIIISHDLIKKLKKFQYFSEFILKYRKLNSNLILAINIKNDGLSNKIKKILNKNKISNYFVFDMSFPEKIIYKKKGINFFNRISEFEKNTNSDLASQGIWIDCFKSIWFRKKILKKINAHHLCFVSPELHGRKNHKKLWFFLKNLDINKKLFLCTDYPLQAKKYFYD